MANEINEKRLSELEEIEDRATPRPWVVGEDPSEVIAPCPCCGRIAICDPYGLPSGDRKTDMRLHFNSEVIVASRNALPDLCASLRSSWSENAALAVENVILRRALATAHEYVRDWLGEPAKADSQSQVRRDFDAIGKLLDLPSRTNH